jgi:hypothetical protein
MLSRQSLRKLHLLLLKLANPKTLLFLATMLNTNHNITILIIDATIKIEIKSAEER